jgi:hypothetical protein
VCEKAVTRRDEFVQGGYEWQRRHEAIAGSLQRHAISSRDAVGGAIIPSFGMPACRNRKVVMSQLINPVVRFDFHMISRRGTEPPPGAVEFTSFLKSYIALWAGRAGVL